MESVTTWDYRVAHLWQRKYNRGGTKKNNALKDMIVSYEKDYLMQWNSFRIDSN